MGTNLHLPYDATMFEAVVGLPVGSAEIVKTIERRRSEQMLALDQADDDFCLKFEAIETEHAAAYATLDERHGLLACLLNTGLGRFQGWRLIDTWGLRGTDSTGETRDRAQMLALIEAQRPNPDHQSIRIGGTAEDWAEVDRTRNELVDLVSEAINKGIVDYVYWA